VEKSWSREKWCCSVRIVFFRFHLFAGTVLSAFRAAAAAVGGVGSLDAEAVHGGPDSLGIFTGIVDECRSSLRALRLPAELQRIRTDAAKGHAVRSGSE
jgi:hypothetical protein